MRKFELDEEWVESIVKDEVEKHIRNKVRKMMVGYASHEYLERVIASHVYSLVQEENPCIDSIVNEVMEDVKSEYIKDIQKLSKSDILNEVVSRLLEADYE